MPRSQQSVPCFEPLRSLLGPVLGVYLVSLVAALCLVQSNSSVLSWVNIHIASSSKLQWNLPTEAKLFYYYYYVIIVIFFVQLQDKYFTLNQIITYTCKQYYL